MYNQANSSKAEVAFTFFEVLWGIMGILKAGTLTSVIKEKIHTLSTKLKVTSTVEGVGQNCSCCEQPLSPEGIS